MRTPINSVHRLSVLLILGGCGLLLVTLGISPSILGLWPFIPGLGGVWFLFTGLDRRRQPGINMRLVSAGFFLVWASLLFLLDSLFGQHLPLRMTWPLFLLGAGTALVIMARSFKFGKRITLLLPAWCLVLLGVIFFLFSIGIIQGDFTAIVRTWWPLLFILSGLALLIASHVSNQQLKNSGVTLQKPSAGDQKKT
ncbi:hypothetical protein [Spirochaeta lutea]|uniref:hypothetical protein n=1 Tax=Spirochaeta lutea TaxID=1480694 RepID=UPI0012E01FF3|nr:hypothetical protein [Spirochaeta lutea]